MRYSGGYLTFDAGLVRAGLNKHTAADMSGLSPTTVGAVNLIQDTPWAINGYILEVVRKLRDIGKNVTNSKGKIKLRFESPDDLLAVKQSLLDSVPKSMWGDMSKEDKTAWKRKAAKATKAHEEALGEFRSTFRIIDLAEEMSEFLKFYFPHNMDFRTRIYPVPTELNTQSSDLARSLLAFSRGETLHKEGVYWMGFSLMTHWGMDKAHPDERYQAALDWSITELGEMVDDPIRNNKWADADKPLLFLAVAHEWVMAHRIPDGPEAFVSHLPGDLDGSCNGAQHLSIMGRDPVGALATNCRNVPERHDLYAAVAERVAKRVKEEASKGDRIALEWLGPVMEDGRDLVKRSVMTVPYGVTEYGVANFMLADGHIPEEAEDDWASAKWIRDIIWAAIGETLEKGQRIQSWFSLCAAICAEAGLPMSWDTPAGSKVTQAYRNLILKRIKAFDTKFTLIVEPDEGEDLDSFHSRVGMDVGKMASAASPNVIHSCDASHLQITVVRMAQAGIRDFSMIHDSFGCHFSKMGLMRDILRQAAVDMYSDNYLMKWKASVEKYSGLTMPDPDFEMGDYDVREILASDYFFS